MSNLSPTIYQRKYSEQYQSKWERPTWVKAASMIEPSRGPTYSCHRDQNPLDNIIGCTSNPNVQENCQARRLSEGKPCPKPCELEHGKPDPCLDKVHHFMKGPNHTIKYADHRDHDIICDEIIGQTPLPSNHFTTPHTHGGQSVALPSHSSSEQTKVPSDQQARKQAEERKEVTIEHSAPKHVELTTKASRPTECKEKDAKAWENCLKNIKNEGDVSHLVHGFEDNAPQDTKQTITQDFKESVVEKAASGKKELQTKASYPTENKDNDSKAWKACIEKVNAEAHQEAKLVSDFVNGGTIGARREEGVHKKESELANKGELRKEFAEGKLK